MAKVLSQIAVVIRGSVGGITYSATREHAIIMRARAGPARLPTNFGTLVRSCFSNAHTLWSAMADAQRADWKSYAETVDVSGPFGVYNLTGLQMFIRTFTGVQYINQRGLTVLGTTITPPVLPGLPNIGPIVESTPVTIGTGIAVSVSGDPDEDAVALIRVTGPWGVARLKNPGNYDTSKDLAIGCTAASATLVEMMGLVEDAVYFLSVRMYLAQAPFRVDNEKIFRLTAVNITI